VVRFLTDQLLRRGVHQSVAALENDVRVWIKSRNENPRPLVWKKTAEKILNSLSRHSQAFRRQIDGLSRP
jgi:hypothetical protein